MNFNPAINYRRHWRHFTPCSSFSIVNFEQVNAGWEASVLQCNPPVITKICDLRTVKPYAILMGGKVKHELRVQIHELRVQIYELRVKIHELRVQIHELRVQIHELED